MGFGKLHSVDRVGDRVVRVLLIETVFGLSLRATHER